MSRAIWTPIAESDLDDIIHYIAFVDRNPIAGERIFHEILDKISEHAERNLPGRSHPNAPEGWFYLRHKRWLIFYQPSPNGLEVMRVIDAVRDLPRQLRDL